MGKLLVKKARVIYRISSQPGKQTITLHIFPNIPLGKGKQTMKLGQLIEYKTKNIFLQKSCRKYGCETSSRPLFVFTKALNE